MNHNIQRGVRQEKGLLGGQFLCEVNKSDRKTPVGLFITNRGFISGNLNHYLISKLVFWIRQLFGLPPYEHPTSRPKQRP